MDFLGKFLWDSVFHLWLGTVSKWQGLIVATNGLWRKPSIDGEMSQEPIRSEYMNMQPNLLSLY